MRVDTFILAGGRDCGLAAAHAAHIGAWHVTSAALEIASRQVHVQTTEQKKREDFRRFLDAIIAELPAGKEIHVILNHYRTHKRNDGWRAR